MIQKSRTMKSRQNSVSKEIPKIKEGRKRCDTCIGGNEKPSRADKKYDEQIKEVEQEIQNKL